MVKFYFYKLTVDAGAAPCVQRDLLSLAICGPVIRSTAEQGSLISGGHKENKRPVLMKLGRSGGTNSLSFWVVAALVRAQEVGGGRICHSIDGLEAHSPVAKQRLPVRRLLGQKPRRL